MGRKNCSDITFTEEQLPPRVPQVPGISYTSFQSSYSPTRLIRLFPAYKMGTLSFKVVKELDLVSKRKNGKTQYLTFSSFKKKKKRLKNFPSLIPLVLILPQVTTILGVFLPSFFSSASLTFLKSLLPPTSQCRGFPDFYLIWFALRPPPGPTAPTRSASIISTGIVMIADSYSALFQVLRQVPLLSPFERYKNWVNEKLNSPRTLTDLGCPAPEFSVRPYTVQPPDPSELLIPAGERNNCLKRW